MSDDEVADLIAEDASRPVAEDKLDAVRELARTAHELELAIKDAEERLAGLKRQKRHVVEVELPELMDSVKLKGVHVEAKGNLPAFTCDVRTIYFCNIPINWEAERRRAAFDYLENHGHGSLIRTEVSVPFSRQDRDKVAAFIQELAAKNRNYVVRESTHHATMTAWLKELAEKNSLPPLDVVGGFIGREAVIKPEKE